ncbi:hypothetical protein LT493_44255 [Streptomyces tricolor]|nr:hypothetical protein [Streptomyces tricolor]
MARHAQRALDAALADGVADEQTARRLFQRLARPDGLGRFVPDTVPVGELDEPQRALARHMARQKLLASPCPLPGEALGESLRMAHEACCGSGRGCAPACARVRSSAPGSPRSRNRPPPGTRRTPAVRARPREAPPPRTGGYRNATGTSPPSSGPI